MEIGKIYTFDKIKMEKEKFINCISYLIACGECLKFNNDMTKLIRFSRFSQKEYFDMKTKDVYDPNNRLHASISSRRDTIYTKMIQDTREGKQSLVHPIFDPSKPFQNKLI